jgi:serine/threonine protein kinase
VETAHRAGVLHRDIKPANILTSEFGDHGLTDFGIAGASVSDVEFQSEGLSIPWSPPEAFESTRALDERSDVYALGATVWHLLAGRSPFEQPGGNNSALMLMERVERSPVPAIGRPDVPSQLERVLTQAMSKNPASRQSSALLFARDLQAVEQTLHLKMTTIVVPSDLPEISQPLEGPDTEDTTRSRIGPKVDPFAPAPPVSPVPSGSARIAEVPKWEDRPANDREPVSAIDQPASRPKISSGVSTLAEEAATRSRPKLAVSEPSEPIEEKAPAPRSRRSIVVGVGITLALAIVVVVVVLLGSSPKNKETGSNTENSSALLIAPTPTNVTASRNGTNIDVNWTNPSPMKGDYFEVAEIVDGQELNEMQSTTTSTQFTGISSTVSPCFTVMLQRQDGGSPSNPSTPVCVGA